MSQLASGPYLIAAGGTGGHMFPALAVAHELARRGLDVLFVTDARGARFIDEGISHRLIAAGSPSGRLANKLLGAWRLFVGCWQSLSISLRHRPLAGACFGGYPAMPPGVAMMLTRVPFLLHEQNAHLGKANRVLARFARKVALSFDATENARSLGPDRCVHTGNPVRPGFVVHPRTRQESDVFRVLVMGGSQGARVFSDVVPEAVAEMKPELRAKLRLTQQCRPEDLDRVRAAYAAVGIEVELSNFFKDVPARMAAADLVVTRSGASTVAEILALGRPSILVPYAYAAEDHQRFNAERLATAGAALTVTQCDFTVPWLKEHLERLIEDRSSLTAMAKKAGAMAQPEAAARLADALTDLHRERSER